MRPFASIFTLFTPLNMSSNPLHTLDYTGREPSAEGQKTPLWPLWSNPYQGFPTKRHIYPLFFTVNLRKGTGFCQAVLGQFVFKTQ